MTASASFPCAACGNVAATVTLVESGQPDPRLTPEPPGVPPGIGTILSSGFRIGRSSSIDGGPISVTHGFVPVKKWAAALDARDAAALFAINSEYAPFWCPRCSASYCRDDFRSWVTFDKGFYDATYGVCPEGHERKLDD